MYCKTCQQYYGYEPVRGAYWPSYYYNPPASGHWRFYRDHEQMTMNIKDHGPNPFVVNIEEAAEHNRNFRTALWTGTHLQVTLMSLMPGEDIGLEIHPGTDQFLRIEDGHGFVQMGARKDRLDFQRNVNEDDAIIVPAGTWHNLTNTGTKPLKLYSIYAPPRHPFGTVQRTKADALAGEGHASY
ncbi:cupin domain-containing protein [Paenibacillus sp. DYY-L-2]|uniref:cupin domain-containing protein n=1 Tax=Paenibacillus sp. DYY-L-2 TaxID=3447013 RepID=UPI003F503234